MAPVKHKCSFIWIGFGSLFLALGLIMVYLWPFIFLRISKDDFELSVNSTSYKMWIKTPIPLYMDIYMFDYVNSENINDKNVKPKFKEVGPFVFLEVHDRDNITWNDNHTVTFYQKRTWVFQPDLSLPLNTSVTSINPLLVVSISLYYTYT